MYVIKIRKIPKIYRKERYLGKLYYFVRKKVAQTASWDQDGYFIFRKRRKFIQIRKKKN